MRIFLSRLAGLLRRQHHDGALDEEIREHLDPTMPLPEINTVTERVNAATRQEALVALLSIVFGALALVLAVVGLYGLMSYTVSRRWEEFGLRVALGASPAGLKRLVIHDSLVLVATGLVIGVAVAAASVGRVSGLLFALEPLDPMAFLVAPAILLAAAAIAAYIPARRVTRLDPAAALRGE
jgi:ABC-type antimicrobial peptide transport system permease subunit